MSLGVEFDLVGVQLGEEVDDGIESVRLEEKEEELVNGFGSRVEACFEKDLKRWRSGEFR